MRNSDKEVDFMSKIGGYTSFDVGFKKNIYEKAKPENKRTDKKPVEKYGAAQNANVKDFFLWYGKHFFPSAVRSFFYPR